MGLAVPVLVLRVDEAGHRPGPARGVHRVQPLATIAIRVVIEDFSGDLVTWVQAVRVLRKRIF